MSYEGDTLPETMQAVVCHGPEDYRLETKPVPTPGPGEVVVKVHSAGICASDVACYLGTPGYWPFETQAGDAVDGYVQPPVTPGHEFVGVVAALGEGSREKYGLEIGDTAVSEQIVPCRSCRFCDRGQYWMCANGDTYGFRAATQGAMADYVLFPANAINHKVPETVPIHHAAYIEPLACAIHAVDRGDIQFGDVIVIAGAGPIGVAMIAAAKLRGPKTIIVTDVIDKRLDLAKAAGADVVLNPSKTDIVKEIRDLSEGYGCDVFIEASGHPSAIEQGLEAVRNLGNIVVFGVFKQPVTVDWSIIGDRKELNIYGSHLGPGCYPIAIDMLAKGLLPMEDIISHALPLSDFQKGFDLAKSGKESLKVTLRPE